MATDLREELRRLQNVVLKLSAEIGGKNQKLEYLEKMLGERSMSLSRVTEERDHLNEAYNEEKSKMKRTMYENDRLMTELETQRKEIEQQAKEIKKLDAQLDFKSKQLLVLRNLNNATKVSRKRNSVQRKPEGVKRVITQDKVQVQIDTNGLHKVQVQIDTNGLHKELEEKGYELDTELNRKQTLADKEHRSNHDLQEAPKVPIEEAKKEDDEKSIELLDEWGKEDIEGSGGVGCNVFQDMFPPIPPPESLVDPCNGMPNNSSDLSSVLAVPDDELAELEWSSTLVENSLFSLDIDFSNNNKKDDSHLFCASNPVSVLKNSSSCSGEKTMPLSPDTVVPRRVRTKRPRSAIFNQQPALNLVSLKPCTVNVQNLPMSNSYIVSESGYFAKSLPPDTPKFNGKQQKKKKEKKRLPPSLPSYSSDHDNPLQQQQQPGVSVQPYTPKFNGKEQKKKKGKKRLPPSLPSYSSDHDNPLQKQQQPPGVAEQKCLHCEITKTPQWREGPMGPKTLCNACGVRYRSGRLFPEYRPAASPTFVASIHSNCHRKVLEMMNVKGTPER